MPSGCAERSKTSECRWIGYPPQRIDVVTSVSGVTFDEAWPRRIYVDVEGKRHPVIGKEDLIRNKRAVARPQDLVDADRLAKKR